jgi:hypothetical protein
MSERHDHRGPPRTRGKPARRALLGVLGAVLAALLVYVLVPGSNAVRAAPCSPGAPEVARVAPQRLAALRESVARVLPQRVGHLYEEGTALPSYLWSDAAPAAPTVLAQSLRPDGYELRWWAPNDAEVVADVFAMPSARAAQHLLALAASRMCRGAAVRVRTAGRPPLARALAWVNPDGWAEADVYIARGSRVYRVADVPSEESPGRAGIAALAGAFATIEVLACLLPDAKCAEAPGGVAA